MYDIHCHILPGIDDGPERLEDSLDMARAAAADGIRGLVATPHGAAVAAIGGKDALAHRIESFKSELRACSIDLEVMMGVENRVSAEMTAAGVK